MSTTSSTDGLKRKAEFFPQRQRAPKRQKLQHNKGTSANLLGLPNELLLKIFSYLPSIHDVVSIERTCKKFRNFGLLTDRRLFERISSLAKEKAVDGLSPIQARIACFFPMNWSARIGWNQQTGVFALGSKGVVNRRVVHPENGKNVFIGKSGNEQHVILGQEFTDQLKLKIFSVKAPLATPKEVSVSLTEKGVSCGSIAFGSGCLVYHQTSNVTRFIKLDLDEKLNPRTFSFKTLWNIRALLPHGEGFCMIGMGGEYCQVANEEELSSFKMTGNKIPVTDIWKREIREFACWNNHLAFLAPGRASTSLVVWKIDDTKSFVKGRYKTKIYSTVQWKQFWILVHEPTKESNVACFNLKTQKLQSLPHYSPKSKSEVLQPVGRGAVDSKGRFSLPVRLGKETWLYRHQLTL